MSLTLEVRLRQPNAAIAIVMDKFLVTCLIHFPGPDDFRLIDVRGVIDPLV